MTYSRPLHAITLTALTATLLAAAAPYAAVAQRKHPTPRIRLIERVTEQGVTLYIRRADLPDSATVVGLAATCHPRLEITTYFGGYFAGRPVQFAGGGVDGRIHRFGPVEGCRAPTRRVSSTPRCGPARSCPTASGPSSTTRSRPATARCAASC